MMRLPLTHWTLRGGSLPDRLHAEEDTGFSLPGAEALHAFAELLGTDGASPCHSEPAERSAPFALPAMLPDDVPAGVCLTREIDFGSLRGDRALLEIDHLAGRGEILLDGQVLARFDSAVPPAASMAAAMDLTGTPCMLAVDLTNALYLGRRRTLTLRFEAARPAGVCGPVFLVSTVHAHLFRVRVTPDARSGLIALRANIRARSAGSYALRAQSVSPTAGSSAAREIRLDLDACEMREAALSMALEAEEFVPGKAYAPAAVKLQLFYRPSGSGGADVLCDEALLLCGYPARGERAFVPLTVQDCAGDPQALADRLSALHVPAVFLPALLPDAAYRALCRAGVAAKQFVPADSPLRPVLARYPNVSFCDAPAGEPLSPEAVAWQLCSMTAFPRAVDGTLTPCELLFEAAGRALDPGEEGVRSVLTWLCAVSVRLRAEAARQGRFSGSLCAPGALASGDVCEALRTAFAPLHLSALPLYGAWWTGARFSASLEAFVPPEETRPLSAAAVLEDENGKALAQLHMPCLRSGHLGVLEAALPSRPCVLTLSCRILYEGETLEEHALPVYVGALGPLEAAFG
ncbi:MAG: hypothetical protein ACI4MP_00750 [Candidatus Ventricola sp.]